MIKVRRDYGNGFAVEVEGDVMTKVLTDLAQADELFYDVRAFGKDDSGKVVMSDKVKFSVRHAKTSQGKPCKYYEQICVDNGALKLFKRHIGEFQERPGEVYVKKGPPRDTSNHVLGFAGWNKYIGTGEQQYDDNDSQPNRGNYGGGNNSGAQQTRTNQPEQRTQNAHSAPPQNNQSSGMSMDDIPF
jgi:hypothetical protein